MSDDSAPAAKAPSALKSFLSGGIGGMSSTMVGHPIDLVKVRIQTMTVAPGEKLPSTTQLLKSTFRKEGITGLYRGVSAPITAIAPIYAVCFWGYDMGQRVVRWQYGMDKSHSNFTLGQICFARGFSAIPTTALMAPSERIKCLLQVQANETLAAGSKPKYSGMIDCGMQLLKEGGVQSLYRGTTATLLRDVPGSIAWFGTYEILKKQISDLTGTPADKLNPFIVMTAGGFAGIANWCVSIPPDVIKSRYQTAPEGKYSGMGEVLKVLLKEEGVGGLFKGIGPAMIRAFPANAAAFLGMETAKLLLAGMD